MTQAEELPSPAHVAQLAELCLVRVAAETVPPPLEDDDSDDQSPERQFQVGLRAEWNEAQRMLRYWVSYAARRDAADGAALDLKCEYAVTFAMPRPFDGSEQALQRFGRTTVAMAVHPFLRQLVASLAVDMSLECDPLPLLRIGDLVPVLDSSPNHDVEAPE